MQVASLRPELEFDVMTMVLLREKHLTRLRRLMIDSKGKVDLVVVSLFDTLRDVSVAVVEAIKSWQDSQVSYPKIESFKWNGQNYLSKMTEDISFLDAYTQINSWLEFSCHYNPFFLPPDLLLNSRCISIRNDAFVIFGKRPHQEEEKNITVKRVNLGNLKSPYNTRIINDPDMHPSASVANRLESIMKGKIGFHGIAGKDTADSTDIYEIFVPESLVSRILKCWDVLCEANFDLGCLLSDSRIENISHRNFNRSMSNRKRLKSSRLSAIETSKDYLSATIVPRKEPWKLASLFMEDLTAQRRRPLINEYLHLTELSTSPQFPISSAEITALSASDRNANLTSSKVIRLWTPHEVNLQKSMERKGTSTEVLSFLILQQIYQNYSMYDDRLDLSSITTDIILSIV